MYCGIHYYIVSAPQSMVLQSLTTKLVPLNFANLSRSMQPLESRDTGRSEGAGLVCS